MKDESEEELKIIRESIAYQEDFRLPMLERDEYRCRICGHSHDLHVHHIKAFYFYPALRLDPGNGLTLCGRCHAILHGKKYEGPIPSVDERVAIALASKVDDLIVELKKRKAI